MARKRRKPVSKSKRKRPVSSGRSAVKRKRNDARSKPSKNSSTRSRPASKRRANASRRSHSATKGKRAAARNTRARKSNKRRASLPRLKRNRQGGLLEFQGYSFDFENFGDFQRAYRTVGDEREHAYDAFMSAKESATEEDNDDE